MSAPVAVVLVHFHTRDLTVAAVESVLPDPLVAEVVVIDNGPGDGSDSVLADRLDDPRVRIVPAGDNIGFGRGANLGVVHATSPYVFLLNTDATVAPGTIGALIDALATDPRVAMAAPLVVDRDGAPQMDAFGTFPSWRTLLLRRNRRPRDTAAPDWLSGVAVLLTRDDFLAIGGFDPDFWMYFEDVDLCRRFRAAGRTLRRVPSVRVVHRSGASRPSPTALVPAYFRSQSLYARKAGWSRSERALLRVVRLPVRAMRAAGG